MFLSGLIVITDSLTFHLLPSSGQNFHLSNTFICDQILLKWMTYDNAFQSASADKNGKHPAENQHVNLALSL